MPTVDRSFARTERIVVRVDAYSPASGAPLVTARLLNRGGTAMADVPVQVSDAGAAEMDVALASLAAGDYLLELNAKAGANTAQDLDRVPGEVGGQLSDQQRASSEQLTAESQPALSADC